MKNYKILGLIANHTCSNIKYNISLNNIITLKDNLTNITIIEPPPYIQYIWRIYRTYFLHSASL
jgi:hypothetical protein